MEQRALGDTGLKIAPIVLGGNVFGWTLDESASFQVLDAFVDQGFNAIDTADCYSAWAPGNKGGESETIIGKWLRARPGMRERVTIFTKVGSVNGGPEPGGLTEKYILEAVERSLQRLGIDVIDLYFAHWPDPNGTSYEETLGAFGKLIERGTVKSIGVSNVNAQQLAESIRVAEKTGLPAYKVLQPGYNLYERSAFEGALRDLCISRGIGVVPYLSLAAGFLSGKYRSQADFGKSQRGGGMGKFMNPRGMAILAALDDVASAHNAAPAEVALAWLIARDGVTAPIASATSPAHVTSFANAVSLRLTPAQFGLLDQAGTA